MAFPRQGKGLFATRNIRKGEVVFVERPVVSSQFLWNALYNYRGERCCLLLVPVSARGLRVPRERPGAPGKGWGLSETCSKVALLPWRPLDREFGVL